MSLFNYESKRKQGDRQEKKIATKMGVAKQSGSGSAWNCKGDLKGKHVLIESKNTNADSMQVKLSWLEKIEHEANRYGKLPLLVIGFRDKRYVIMREDDYLS